MKPVKCPAVLLAAMLFLPMCAFSYPSVPFCQEVTYRQTYFGQTMGAVEALETLRVDSIWYTYDIMHGHGTHIILSVLSTETVDTSVFTNSGTYSPLDTSFLTSSLVDSGAGQWQGVKQGDTLKDAFVLYYYSTGYSNLCWSFVSGACAFLVDTNPAFPLQNALATFNGYLDKNKFYRGYAPPAGPLKLGPVFQFLGGDVGWGLRAFSQGDAWFLEHSVGDGDCQAGCIQNTTTLYKVTADGAVTLVDSKCGPNGCATRVLNRGRATKTAVYHPSGLAASECYDIQGRRVAGFGARSNGKVPAGVYFVRESNSKLAKMLIKNRN